MMEFELEELVPLVAKLTEQYTSKESSSVTYEKARQLMDAVVYCIREQEHSMFEETALLELKDFSAEQAYEYGYQLVIRKVKEALQIFHEILKEFKDYKNRSYSDTIVKGIPKFFQYYDAKFNPQNTILTLDYPTMLSVEPLTGIDVIYQYLQYIQVEQHFLNAFSDDYVRNCLESYHPEYKELFINISSVVLRYTLEKIAEDLKTDEDFHTREEMEQFYDRILKIFIKNKFENEEALYNYLKMDLKEFSILKFMSNH